MGIMTFFLYIYDVRRYSIRILCYSTSSLKQILELIKKGKNTLLEFRLIFMGVVGILSLFLTIKSCIYSHAALSLARKAICESLSLIFNSIALYLSNIIGQ